MNRLQSQNVISEQFIASLAEPYLEADISQPKLCQIKESVRKLDTMIKMPEPGRECTLTI